MVDLTQLSPASRICVLKEQWKSMSDIDLFEAIGQTADEFAKGSPNSAGWHFANLLREIGIRPARPDQIACSRCGKFMKVNQ